MKPIDAIRLQLKAMELMEGTELDWWEVIRDKTSKKAFNYQPAFDCHVSQYELALDTIEGKPVWAGDEIYTDTGLRFTVEFTDGPNIYGSQKDGCSVCWNYARLSWLPPAPKTAMVELLVTDIEMYIKAEFCGKRLSEACRKTLEELK